MADEADLLSPGHEAQLTEQSAALEKRTGHQFVIVTVNSLGGKAIEDYGMALGNFWGVGRKGVDDGVLLIVAPKEKMARIEVGRGLEKKLTDEEAAAILQNAILPRFRERKMAEGIVAGSDGIVQEIGS